jgi:hypothetical protein
LLKSSSNCAKPERFPLFETRGKLSLIADELERLEIAGLEIEAHALSDGGQGILGQAQPRRRIRAGRRERQFARGRGSVQDKGISFDIRDLAMVVFSFAEQGGAGCGFGCGSACPNSGPSETG